ncbi:MAG: HDOD domain-containing protein [Ectothiorhodospiraceae bacterium]|nr:HDOD domain-containing protein [Chromatiales bacterium]MCP5155012.1 HDOD domain-containing protein [Ectothiorhodospiraceae bacterium]
MSANQSTVESAPRTRSRPPAPMAATVGQLQSLRARPALRVANICQVVLGDVGLSRRLLEAANAARRARPEGAEESASAPTVSQAVALLGVERSLEICGRPGAVADTDPAAAFSARVHLATELARALAAARGDRGLELAQVTAMLLASEPDADDLAPGIALAPVLTSATPGEPSAVVARLAARTARAVENGWSTADTARCLGLVAVLTGDGDDGARRLVRDAVLRAARRHPAGNTLVAARALPLPPGLDFDRTPAASEASPPATAAPNRGAAPPAPARARAQRSTTRRADRPAQPVPRPAPGKACMGTLARYCRGEASVQDALGGVLDCLVDELGFESATFAILSKDRTELTVRLLRGPADAPGRGARIPIAGSSVLAKLLDQPRALRLPADRPAAVALPSELAPSDRASCLMSVFAGSGPVGLVSASRPGTQPSVDDARHALFKRLCEETSRALTRRTG